MGSLAEAECSVSYSDRTLSPQNVIMGISTSHLLQGWDCAESKNAQALEIKQGHGAVSTPLYKAFLVS